MCVCMRAAILLVCFKLASKNQKGAVKYNTFTADITSHTHSIYLCWHQLHRHDSSGIWEDIQVVSFICEKYINPRFYEAFSPSPKFKQKGIILFITSIMFRKPYIFHHKRQSFHLHFLLYFYHKFVSVNCGQPYSNNPSHENSG